MKLKWLINTTAIVLLIVIALVGLASRDSVMAAQNDSSKIEGLLVDRFTADGSADFIVRFTDQADLSPAYTMDWKARGEFVYNTLVQTANSSQSAAKGILDLQGLKYQTFFSGNELYVWTGTLAVANELAALPEVGYIRATRNYNLDPYTVSTPFENISWAGDLLAKNAITTVGATPNATMDWGLTDSKADQFWAAYGKGLGTVVANIDTGVQWNHPALDQSFKCGTNPSDPACWSDPENWCGGSACDNNGHGTHTMGTMVGDDDPSLTYIVGMAPDAQWIACKGCGTSSCSDFALNSCADWIVAPNGDPANRPDVVNNSWGGGGGDTWYLTKVNAWRAAGIFPAFSAGNNYTCSSLGSPGDYQESFGSAAHASSRTIADFSSKGPSPFGHDPYTKPNLSAPGVNICSSVPGNGWNCGYSGTSMASPHTAGAVALLWACNPSLVGQVDATFQLLQNNTDTAPAGSCGAPPDGQGNYTYGYGYLDVLSAGLMTCGAADFGSMDGYVLDNNNAPVEGATVSAVPGIQDNQVQAITDPTGYYTMTIPVGTYNVTASKVNYEPMTVNGVQVLSGLVTHQDFSLFYLGSWTQLANGVGCPDWTRFDMEYFAGTGLAYILGGRTGNTTLGTIYSYNTATNTCVNTGKTMPVPISNFTIGLLNNGTADVLCTFGGRDGAGGYSTAVQCYDPIANTVANVGTLPGNLGQFIPGGVAVVDNTAYVFSGFRNTTAPYHTTQNWAWDPVANTWTQKADIGIGRGYIVTAVVDGKIYAFGGDVFDGTNLVAQTVAEVYDPVANAWDDGAVADLASASGEGRAFGFDTASSYLFAGQIVIAGGGQWPNDTNAVIAYDVATNTYDDTFPDLNITRRNQAGFFVPGDPGAMFVFGGRSSAVGYGGDNPPYAPPEFYDVPIALKAPIIAIDPPELNITLLPNHTGTAPFTVGNSGNADLTWNLYDGVPNPAWVENFDSYAVGSQMHGQGGWKGWDNVPGAGALVSDAQSHSASNSVAILGASDLTHPYSGFTSGSWVYTAWQFIPTSFSGQTYFILLNTYTDGGPYNWSVEVNFDAATGLLTNDGPKGGSLPMIKNQWVEIRVEINLDTDTQTFFYGGTELFTDSWKDGMSGGGVDEIANVDLFANGATVVYYDDVSLVPASNPACGIYGDVPWLSTNPTNGTTLPGETSPVDGLFDTAGLSVGTYTATLCAASNDPATPIVPIPVTLIVENENLYLPLLFK